MNKRLISLALGAALAAGSLAAQAGVKVGGYANVSLDRLSSQEVAGGPTANGSFVSSNASNVVITGTTDLGDGLSGIVSVQSFLSMGSDGSAAPISGVNDGVGLGDTYAGVKGGWGMLAAGKNDSPIKILGRELDLFNNEIGDSRNLISADGAGVATNGFDQRPGHTIFYVSPNLSGLLVRLAYTAENSASDTAPGASQPSNTPTGKAITDDFSVTYNNGPMMGGVAYEVHSDNTYAATAAGLAEERAWRVGGSFNMSPVRVVALYQNDRNLGGESGANLNVWGVGAGVALPGVSMLGHNTIKVQYYKTAGVSGINNSGAHLIDVGLDHAISHKATVYLDYSKVSNESAANYSDFGGGHGNVLPVAAGSAPHAISAGMILTF
ncbi:MAG: porin [Acidiferrobacteraceae bacterium]